MTASKQSGFTLIELLVTCTVLGILAVMALPSFSEAISSTRARKASDVAAGMVGLARSTALNKSADVYLSIHDGRYCLSAITGTQTDKNCAVANAPVDTGVQVSISSPITGSEIMFDRVNGAPSGPAQITVSSGSATKVLKMNLLGLVSIGG